MTTGISALIDISRRSLGVQSQSIRVIGNNINNVNNADYARRVVNIISDAATGANGIVYGSGATITSVTGVVDNFLNKNYIACLSESSSAQIQSDYLQRAEALFSLDSTNGRIGTELAKFFSALEDLQSDPSSLSYRLGVLNQGQTLTSTISSTYNNLAELQREANDRMEGVVGDINRITAGIATLNEQISKYEATGQEALSLHDQRDGLLKELAKNISFSTTTQKDGTINVTLSNGFGLVTGFNSNQLKFSPTPSFVDGKNTPSALDGGSLGFITFDYDKTGTTPTEINLTSIIAAGDGELAGLLKFRGVQTVGTTSAFDVSGSIVEAATYVETIARDLLTRFNLAYLAVENGESTSGNLLGEQTNTFVSGVPQNTFALFSFRGANNSLTGGADLDSDGIPSQSDLEKFGLNSYASLLTFNLDDPSKFSAALNISNVSGTYQFADGDGSNIQNLLDQKNARINYNLGAVQVTSTISQLYDTTVSRIGVMKKEVTDAAELASGKVSQAEAAVSAVSGVDLDEEFAKLILYQKAYEASARMINVASTLLDELINLLR
ncbi:MAG: flagellar hook-associated protein FlgK [Deltaproteobacteria bacterium]|jgi:flagellar hook-associated protein 1 FlgK|nr:flagellar hook-associated protein FlgK [Deltaproteobacteria bacterium]